MISPRDVSRLILQQICCRRYINFIILTYHMANAELYSINQSDPYSINQSDPFETHMRFRPMLMSAASQSPDWVILILRVDES